MLMKKAILFLLLCPATMAVAQRLHENSPARYFEEAFVIGNGTMGGTVYATPGNDRISLNDITLWTGEPVKEQIDSVKCAHVLAAMREVLQREDYRTADSLQRFLQGSYSENYQPLGALTIVGANPADEVTDYQRWLDISTAVAGMSYKCGGTRFSTDYFCSCPDQVMVVRLKSSRHIAVGLGMLCELPHQTSAAGDELIVDGYAAYHSLPHYVDQPQRFWYDSARGIHFRTIVKVLKGRVERCDGDELHVAGDGEVVLLIANATSFNGPDKDPVKEGADYRRIAGERIERASQYSYDQLLGRHMADYKQYFDRVEIDLGKTPSPVAKLPTSEQLRRYTALNEHNPDLEELYFQFGRYLLISCSRTPGVPATLQGLWNEQILPPWSSNYTCNINLEENYWPAEVANLPEMHMPLLAFVKRLQENGQTVASRMYGVQQGWCSAHNSDIWAMAHPVGAGTGDPVWANWNMGGAWLATHIWEHYLFTRDYEFLMQYYHVLRGAAEFCMDWLVEKDGDLMTMPSTSPENKYLLPDGYSGATFYGGTADRAIIGECVADAAYATWRIGLYSDFARLCDTVLKQLIPYSIGRNGNLQEWYGDWADAEPHHRHQSHLFGLYPGHSITSAHADLLAACRTTLALRGTETTGWSTGWRINLYARMGDGEMAYKTLRQLLRYVSPDGYQGADAVRGGGTYPNLLDAHSPFQIDGNFGGLAGMCEMLVQSSCQVQPSKGGCKIIGKQEYLPALPYAWEQGHIKGLRLRTGKAVEIKWKKGRIKKLRLLD